MTCVLVALLLTAAFSLKAGFADNPDRQAGADKPNPGGLGERRNAVAVALISGNPNATHLTIAYDRPDAFDEGDNFRVLSVIRKGGGRAKSGASLLTAEVQLHGGPP